MTVSSVVLTIRHHSNRPSRLKPHTEKPEVRGGGKRKSSARSAAANLGAPKNSASRSARLQSDTIFRVEEGSDCPDKNDADLRQDPYV